MQIAKRSTRSKRIAHSQIDVMIVNTRSIKNVPGQKTDIAERQSSLFRGAVYVRGTTRVRVKEKAVGILSKVII